MPGTLEKFAAERLSARKMESYKRAEVVAQALRLYIALGPHATQKDVDLMSDALLDWMDVTGKLRYAAPVRRSKVKRR
jgi:hypothetical protein